MSELKRKKVEEFDISVPWGHIAVKAWGTNDNPHVLMVHGTGDNAGTFDNLVALLPNCFYYICIDLPGHGKSSHFPPYLPIHSTDYLIVCKLVLDYFKKEKYIFIGHSLGGQVGFFFAQVYPDYFEKFISLDAVPSFFPVESKKSVDYLRKRIDKNIQMQGMLVEERGENYENILEKFSKNRYHGEILTKKAASPMVERILTSTVDGNFTISTDKRVFAAIDPLNDTRYKIINFKNDPVTCPLLIIFAKNNVYPRKKYNDLLTTFSKMKNVKIVYIDGKHDVHNNNPELVAKYVNKFLIDLKSKM